MTPFERFKENITEALTLLQIHEDKTGTKRGRRYGVETINKGCIVLLTACWEALIEDIAGSALRFVVSESRTPHDLPISMQKGIAKRIKGESNELSPWELAGDGWKNEANKFQQEMIRKHIGSFNTPKATNIENLFQATLDLSGIAQRWTWRKMTSEAAGKKLEKYLTIRHEIAHQLSTSNPVYKKDVREYALFILKISLLTLNAVSDHLATKYRKKPWPTLQIPRKWT